MSYNLYKGFYLSSVILDAPWESELDQIAKKYPELGNYDDPKKRMQWLSFKSYDGGVYTKGGKGGPEFVKDYKWTELYWKNPILKAVITWFNVKTTRVRIGQARPNNYIPLHYDLENKILEGKDHQVRIFLQLTDTNSWYRVTDGDSDVTFKMQRGQFFIADTDIVMHATQNIDNNARTNLVLHAKTNFWVKNLTELYPKVIVINPQIDHSQPHQL